MASYSWREQGNQQKPSLQRKTPKIMNKRKGHPKRPQTWLVVSYIVPNESSAKDKDILEDQLKIFIGSYRSIEESLGLYIYTNNRQSVTKVAKKLQLRGIHMHVHETTEEDLTFCHGQEGEHFRYAFSKLDALEAAKGYFFGYSKGVKQIILSDIDCYLSEAKPLSSERLGIDRLQALDYRSEQTTTAAFDRLMTTIGMEIGCERKEFAEGEAAWINSGMLVIPTQLLASVCDKNLTGIQYMRKNKEAIKECCAGHYGDEILLSAIFNSEKNRRIELTKNEVAQLIWTCKTINPTFHWISIFRPPAHLHLPAIKFMDSQRRTLKKMVNARIWKNHRTALILNTYSVEERYVNGMRCRPMKYVLKLLLRVIRFSQVRAA